MPKFAIYHLAKKGQPADVTLKRKTTKYADIEIAMVVEGKITTARSEYDFLQAIIHSDTTPVAYRMFCDGIPDAQIQLLAKDARSPLSINMLARIVHDEKDDEDSPKGASFQLSEKLSNVSYRADLQDIVYALDELRAATRQHAIRNHRSVAPPHKPDKDGNISMPLLIGVIERAYATKRIPMPSIAPAIEPYRRPVTQQLPFLDMGATRLRGPHPQA